MGALTADRQALTVTQATVAADVHEALDVLALLTTEVALDHEVGLIDVLADGVNFLLGEVLDTGVRIDVRLRADLAGGGAADAVNVGQTDLDALLAREIDTANTGQRSLLSLTLTLLVARVLANDEHLAMAPDDLALVAHLLDGRTYLHDAILSVVLKRIPTIYSSSRRRE